MLQLIITQQLARSQRPQTLRTPHPDSQIQHAPHDLQDTRPVLYITCTLLGFVGNWLLSPFTYLDSSLTANIHFELCWIIHFCIYCRQSLVSKTALYFRTDLLRTDIWLY